MTIVITDMTVCEGGNHVTLLVSEDGGEPRRITVDIENLSPDRTFAEIAQHMGGVPAADVEPLYRATLTIRNALAYTFEDMRTAVLAVWGPQ
jgi:hypothetical protein